MATIKARRLRNWIWFVSAAWLGAAPALAQCGKTCLLGKLNDYEAHMLHHDAQGIVTSADFRAVENYRPTPLGQGYFGRVRQIYHQLQFADPVSGQTAAIGMLDDGGRDAYFVLRLKVAAGGAISQSEMLLIHDGETSFLQTDRSKKLDPVYLQPVPENLRSTREQLIQDVDNFTDAWQFRDESLFDYTPDCVYLENNVTLTEPGQTTCGDMLEYGGARGVPGAGNSRDRGPVGGQMKPALRADPSIGRPVIIGVWVRDRRVLIVDPEHGVVVAWHIQGGQPARPGEPVQYGNNRPFAEHSMNRIRTAAENKAFVDGMAKRGGPGPGKAGGPPPGGGGAAYMASIFKIIGGKIVRVDHFEWEGGPNASGGFSDGPRS